MTTNTWRLVPAEPDQVWTDAFAARGPRIGSFGATIRAVLDTAPTPTLALVTELQAIRAALTFLPATDAAVSGLDRIIAAVSPHDSAGEANGEVSPLPAADRSALLTPSWDEIKEANSILASYSWNSNGEGGGVTESEIKLAKALLRVAGVDWNPNGDPEYKLPAPVADERAALAFPPATDAAVSGLDRIIAALDAGQTTEGAPTQDASPNCASSGGRTTLATSIFGEKIGCALDGPSSAAGDVQTDAARDVLAERRRQIDTEGFGASCDDFYTQGELAEAAACYAGRLTVRDGSYVSRLWPWPAAWWKPTTYRRDLVKAGALILAEIERLDRAAPAAGPGAARGERNG